MDARVSAALGARNGATSISAPAPPKSDIPDDAAVEGGSNGWPDESAEAAFRAEARERGEPELPAAAPLEASEETDTKNLPPLEDLVKRISPEARELMDELFRAKFTTVRRVPAKALKN